jgi:hypothetical protein
MISQDALFSRDPTLPEEIEHFFVSYNEIRGKRFHPIGRHGPKRAKKLIEKQRRPEKS